MRRAQRQRLGPLRIELQSGGSGTLIDISELGALLDLPAPSTVNSHLSFVLTLAGVAVRLDGRVVRSGPCFGDADRVSWVDPTSYHTAVEFVDSTSHSTTLRELLKKAFTENPTRPAGSNDHPPA